MCIDCYLYIELNFLDTTTLTPLNQEPDADFTGAGIQIRISPIPGPSQCALDFTTSTLTTESVILLFKS